MLFQEQYQKALRQQFDQTISTYLEESGLNDLPTKQQLQAALAQHNTVQTVEYWKKYARDNIRERGTGEIESIKDAVRQKVATWDFQEGNDWLELEYDLGEIGRAEDVESYIAQANRKKTGLMFKEGWEFVGSNPKSLKFIKRRVREIELSSGVPFKQLMRDIGFALIRTNNCFVYINRDHPKGGGVSLSGKEFKWGKRTYDPIVSLEIIPPETIRYKVNKLGHVKKWAQFINGEKVREFKTDEVIHFHLYRRPGFVAGTPVAVPVLDDILSLREVEENVLLLIHQFLFPLLHWKVGSDEYPATITSDGHDEIELAKEYYQAIPTEGGLITSHRHSIELIGSENQALRIEDYITHFRERILAGLGISTIDIGLADTANRATSETLSRALVDTVKDAQDAVELHLNFHFIQPLLREMEGEKVLEEKNLVFFRFNEIDINNKIKKEEHARNLFESDGITWSEFRQLLGRDPIDVDVDSEEWLDTNWKMFREPTLLIQALDEPWSPQAQALARARVTDLQQSDNERAIQESRRQAKEGKSNTGSSSSSSSTRGGNAGGATANTSKNQHGTHQTKPIKGRVMRGDNPFVLDKKIYGDILTSIVPSMEEQLLLAYQAFRSSIGDSREGWDVNMASSLFNEQYNAILDRFMYYAFSTALTDRTFKDAVNNEELNSKFEHFFDLSNKTLVKKFVEDVREKLKTDERSIQDILDTFEYRLRFTASQQPAKAYNLGRAIDTFDKDPNARISFQHKEGACDTCREHSANVHITSSLEVHPSLLTPLHSGCSCDMIVDASTTG